MQLGDFVSSKRGIAGIESLRAEVEVRFGLAKVMLHEATGL
jgi:hypothetical protein